MWGYWSVHSKVYTDSDERFGNCVSSFQLTQNTTYWTWHLREEKRILKDVLVVHQQYCTIWIIQRRRKQKNVSRVSRQLDATLVCTVDIINISFYLSKSHVSMACKLLHKSYPCRTPASIDVRCYICICLFRIVVGREWTNPLINYSPKWLLSHFETHWSTFW